MQLTHENRKLQEGELQQQYRSNQRSGSACASGDSKANCGDEKENCGEPGE
jgi:hypothetical protein